MKILVLSIAIMTSGYTFAAEHKVDQKDQKFSVKELKVKVGDKITFTNSDKVHHNVFSKAKDIGFKLKTQPPGGSSTVSFTKKGTGQIRCAIHPGMKMNITVE